MNSPSPAIRLAAMIPVTSTATVLAALRNEPIESFARNTVANTRRLFNLP
jgi:Tat protein secretion system quality control protein TatD with DNase activity